MTAKLKKRKMVRWSLKWYSRNYRDGITEYIIFENCLPKFFLTRETARQYANEKYRYIKTRKDLKEEPHGWRFPKAIKIRITIEEL